ncbi:hypothetical protein [Flavobacterium stagni]|uniref:DUF4468 domain-containing protein n=1 Tax=Flavobacterium stagni TaxID=2506421 RepID=A0A4Q1K1L0_9FLAO|nr:hypothetical protein [Flavobacterium stagni]RXR18883.1 hypothetical protein EQG61_13575 [Flavobacterium stagni]
MKNLFNLILFLSVVCSAQIDNTFLLFQYRKFGINGKQINVEFKIINLTSIMVYKTIDNKMEMPFEIEKVKYDLLIKELKSAVELKPKEEEIICSHGNYLHIQYKENGKYKNIESECISPKMNSWAFSLLEKFLKLIDEKEIF